MKKKFSVFANFYIDTHERFLRLQDSFFSFKNANIHDWNINIRGKYKYHVSNFLKENIKKNLFIFFKESKKGWIEDSKIVAKNIKKKIVFIWIEDHICVQKTSRINSIVNEMYNNQVDHLIYTFFHKGIFLKPLKVIKHLRKKYISVFEYNLFNYDKIKTMYEKKKTIPNYLISGVSFMSRKLFEKNLEISKKKKKYNKMLPFNFEKSFFENDILPFNNGVLNNELFISIDDDHGEKGYSLISRKKYPNRVSKKQMDLIRKKKINIFKKNIFKSISSIVKP